MTPREKESLKMKICCACNKEKEIKSFYKSTLYKDGFENRCKICKQNCIKCRKPAVRKITKKRNEPALWNVNKQDWVDTYEFLKTIGYCLTKNIHEQFCEKHNLTPKKRGYEKSVIYSPQDLDLI
jgi:hypothetical protein